MKKSILTEAYKIACYKLRLHPNYDHYIHYSFIIQDNKIIEWGTNTNAVPAIHFGYQARLDNSDFQPKTHSEWMAYKRARGLLNKKKSFDLINIRLNRQKELKLSKPCEYCYPILMSIGCRKIYYSDDLGFLRTS